MYDEPVNAYDCEEHGHLWMIGKDPCTQCGLPWSEVYALERVIWKDGRVTMEVVAIEDQPHASRLLHP